MIRVPQGSSVPEAKRFYDRFGRLQDVQALYEGRALRWLEEAGRFEAARSVFEFGCGTGAFARRLLDRRLPDDARYLGVDVSETMVRIARRRLRPWRDRADVRLVSGELPLDEPSGAYDRFVSNYVFDLLTEHEIAGALSEAHRILQPDGLLCLASLTYGATPAARAVTRLWLAIHRRKPWWIGGCRPIELLEFVGPPAWTVLERRVITQLGVSSEAVVARKRAFGDGQRISSARLVELKKDRGTAS